MTRPFRFSVNMTIPTDGAGWRDKCRRAEELGYDVIQVPDHLGMMAPFPALVAAAAVTRRPRLGTFVLNAGFWNPALLAREIATTDALTGGRLEIGLGAGYVKEEHDRAGLDFPGPGGRVDRLRHTVGELIRLLEDDEHRPAPAQRPRPPLMIGGDGDRVLKLAADHADIVAFSAGRDTERGMVPIDADQLDERVAAYRKLAGSLADPAGERELNLLLQVATVTDDPLGAAEAVLARAPALADVSPAQLLAYPQIVIGTVREIADKLRTQRERYGFTYVSVLDDALEAFAPVIEELRED
ncbi:TIGR03621 family F420-dependent LLM class oxidoreductase [Streptomyces sp. NPDC051018]|uniref:TIGR03621 family F420-dependent LLM class oxidoreductase n=1 Tax=Streptomyces sp. NPDC051018 TaxID=3365639 RepID=UPI00378A1DDD